MTRSYPALLAMTVAVQIAAPAGTAAAPATANQAAAARANDLIAILNGGGQLVDSFTPTFLADVPAAQLRALAAQIVAEGGRALRIGSVTPAGTNRYALTIVQERATASAVMTLDPAPPGRIAGLTLTAASARLPTLAAAVTALKALPGTTALSVARLGGDRPVTIVGANPDRAQAVGSTFKLLVLAELVRAIDAGERRWTDVAPLTNRSVPSGILQDWPDRAPLTLHSLAALMISRSDNSATDTLIALLGRDRIAAMGPALGWPALPGNDPFLTTLEMATLKGTAGGTPADTYARATPAARRGMLAGRVAATPRTAIDYAALETRPHHIDTIEWFASPNAVVTALDWFRRGGAKPDSAAATALTLLAISPGLPGTDPSFGYVGYKGGSEAGVLAMSYLLRTRGGTWYAVSASWNDPTATLAERRLVAILTRVVQLVGEEVP
ncbi:serine hydrolase [Sphingomonas arantia]|uniref:Serine hydrolase n=1 Tax=Sphingomonas arantia TaxID=1460676 RepID=A0ABW4U1E2_9SPHN